MRQRINRIGHVPIPPMIWMQGMSQAHILLHALAWRIETDPTDEFAMFIFYCQPSIPAIFQRDLAILFLKYSTGKGCGQ